MFKKEESAKISREDSLNGIPVINTGASLEKNPSGETVLMVERDDANISWFFRKFTGGKMTPKQLILDELGEFVVRQIDGKKNVMKIIKIFSKEFKLHHRESESSVVAFLNSLMQRNVVSVVFPDLKIASD